MTRYRELPFWVLPPVALVIFIAVVTFPFRLLYEWAMELNYWIGDVTSR